MKKDKVEIVGIFVFAVLFGVFIFAILLNSVLVFSLNEINVTKSGGGLSVFNVSEDLTFFFNFTLNNSFAAAGVDGNITQINFTFPSGFGWEFDLIGNNFSNAQENATFTNYSVGGLVLSWYNESGIVGGGGAHNYSFSFNFTIATPGNYDGADNITVTVLNWSGGIGTSFFYFNLTVNDTTAPNVSAPTDVAFSNFNYSGGFSINMSILDNRKGGSTSAVDFVNITLYNASNDGNGSFRAFQLTGSFWNFTFNSTIYPEGLYNISIRVNDTYNFIGGNNVNGSLNLTNVRFDNTAPVEINNTNNFTNVGGNISGTVVLNYTLNDALSGGGSLYLVLINASEDVVVQGINLSIHTSGVNLTMFNGTFDTSTVRDGVYNITVIANDSANNNITLTNSSYRMRIDNTIPTGVVSCTPAPVLAGSVVTCTCSPADGGSDINTSATVIVANPSTANTGTFTHTCDFKDLAGNVGTASTSYSVELGGSGGGGGGGGSSSVSFYSSTIPIVAKDFSELQTITQQIKNKQRIKIKIGESEPGKNDGEIHYIGVRSITLTSAVIEISSDPVRIDLDVGEDAKLDVTHDGFYDIYLKLNRIVNGKADLLLNSIHEEIPEPEEDEEASNVETSGEIVPIEDSKGSTLIWVIVGLVVVLVVVGWVYMRKKRK